MAQKLTQTQTLTQAQVQTLAPQQLLVVRLLELPVTDLENRVNNELMENSALEEGPDEDTPQHDEETDNGTDEGDEPYSDYDTRDDYYADSRADYASDDETPDYLFNTYNDRGETTFFASEQTESFYDQLKQQIGEHELTDKQQEIVEYLIGSLDSDGLLRKPLYTISDELAIYHHIDADEKEIEEALRILQTFEPCGIAARSLQECLELQLRNLDFHSPYKDIELKIICQSFDDFIRKRMDRLSVRYRLDDETAKRVFSELTHLNPRPGSALGDTTDTNSQQVTPDFYVTQDESGAFDIRLNQGDVPELRVSRSFRNSLDEYSHNRDHLSRQQKEAFLYTKQKVEAAQNFINAIQQRRDTLLRTMQTIVSLQEPFFEEGDESLLRPMILKDVAQRTGLDISTISRVSNSKYVQTAYGIYPLKYFFNDKFTTQEGEELSKAKIKTTLKEIIDAEDKASPISDEVLADILKQKGYPVARRTVAKYREQMGIPVARLRK